MEIQITLIICITIVIIVLIISIACTIIDIYDSGSPVSIGNLSRELSEMNEIMKRLVDKEFDE